MRGGVQLRFYLFRLLATLSLVGTPAAFAAPTPRLVIAISVDQFSSEVYARYRENYSAGLKRLSSGIAFPVGYQSHATTETCPGHSTILTGDHPSHTGIIGNSWFDRDSGSTVCALSGGKQGPAGARTTKAKGDYPRRLDQAGSPKSRVVAISGKDRAAIMMGGHKPDLVAWWVDGVGFETSRYAGRANDEIQNTGTRECAASQRRGVRLRRRSVQLRIPLMPVSGEAASFRRHRRQWDGAARRALEATAAPGFAVRKEFRRAFRASPLSDALALDFAANMAERWKLGSRSTDLWQSACRRPTMSGISTATAALRCAQVMRWTRVWVRSCIGSIAWVCRTSWC